MKKAEAEKALAKFAQGGLNPRFISCTSTLRTSAAFGDLAASRWTWRSRARFGVLSWWLNRNGAKLTSGGRIFA